MAKGAIRIDWFPGDALDGMKFLTASEELAYRRIIDLLYISGGELPDDAEVMAEQTRTFADWEKVRGGLIRKGKIAVSEGMITNEKCTEILTQVAMKSAKAAESGRASGKVRRHLLPTKHERTQNERSSDRSTDAATIAPTNGVTNDELSHIVSKVVRETDVSLTAGVREATKQVRFADFFNTYPRKETIFEAEVVWDELVADGVDPAQIIAGMHRWIAKWAADKVEARYIPAAVTWLKARRWLDPIDVADPAPKSWSGPAAFPEAIRYEFLDRGLSDDDAAAFIRSYLAPAEWIETDDTIVAATKIAAEKLRSIGRLRSYTIVIKEARAA